MKRLKTLLGLIGCLAAATAANADQFSFSLTNPNFSGYTGPYGSAVVTWNSTTTASITFTANAVGGFQYLFSSQGAVAVNVNATHWTMGTPTFTQLPGFTTASLSDGGSGNEDGFGKFNQTIDNSAAYPVSVNSVTFTLTDTSGTWANAAAVLKANSQGNTVAAHILVTDPNNPSAGALVTGYATDGSAPPIVPDGGSTAALMGLAMLGIGSVRRILSK